MLASSPLCLSGSCTVATVPGHRDRLVAAVTGGDGPVVLDLVGLDEADVTLAQLLVAARSEAVRRGRGFAVAAWSPTAADVLARAGLDPAAFAPSAVPAGA